MKSAKKLLSLVLLMSFILALPSCSLFGSNTMDGDKNVLERTYELDGSEAWRLDVSDINFSLAAASPKMYVKTGSQYGSALKIATDDNVFTSLTVTIDEAERTIEISGKEDVNYNPSEFAITVGVPVDEVELDGGYTLDMIVDAVKELKVDVDGAASANIVTERLTTLTFDVDGAAKVTLEGSADSLLFEADGAATLDAFDFEAVSANLSLEGAASAKVNVTSELYAAAEGTCAIEYKGDCEVKSQTMNGLSTLTKAE